MSSLVTIAVSAVLILLLLHQLRWRHLRQLAAEHSSTLPILYPHVDPVFGLDFLLSQVRAFVTNTRLENLSASFAHLHSLTWATRRFGGLESIETADPVNIHAIWTDRSSGSWGVAPGRLEQLEPFCGRGFVNADGVDWERSRGLMKLGLNKEEVDDLRPFELALQDLFQQLPEDGGTVDLQPLLGRLVRPMTRSMETPYDS